MCFLPVALSSYNIFPYAESIRLPCQLPANYERIKTRAGRLSRARVICGGGNPPLAETIPGRLAAARARRIS